jgi:hypothetical protein
LRSKRVEYSDKVMKLFDASMQTLTFYFITFCFTVLCASFSSAQETGSLPEFTFKGIALHPDDLSYAPTDQLVHPTIIKTEGRATNPLGKYYLYYSPHKHIAISMAYSNSIEGPWIEYQDNPVINGPAAPDIRWIKEKGKFYMWGHTKNTKTELWTSDDGLQFGYAGVSITADNIGTKNATYTRVYEYPLNRFGSKYIMLYSGLIEERGIRCIWLAHSTDAENWIQLKDPLVEPVDGEYDNVYGPALLQYDHRNFIVYQDQTSWRGGNIKYVEVDTGLHQVGNGGERFVLLDPSPGPPLNDRYRGGEFYLENDTFYMYSSASRDPRMIVYATANAVPVQDTTVSTNVSKEINDSQVSIYPNPFRDLIIVDLTNQTFSSTMRIYDLNGRLLKTVSVENISNHIEIPNLRDGIYILEIMDMNHDIIHRQKIVRYK